MNTINISRELVTDWIDAERTQAYDGITLKSIEERIEEVGEEHYEGETGWLICDGRDEEHVTDPADALRTYADWIENCIDDQDAETTARWQAEIDRARADAEQL